MIQMLEVIESKVFSHFSLGCTHSLFLFLAKIIRAKHQKLDLKKMEFGGKKLIFKSMYYNFFKISTFKYILKKKFIEIKIKSNIFYYTCHQKFSNRR
jgi:hypothetical protein